MSADNLTNGTTNKVLTAAEKTNLGGLKKNSLNESTVPGISQDSSAGYSVGSRWINVSTQTVYTCVDASTGAAVWV